MTTAKKKAGKPAKKSSVKNALTVVKPTPAAKPMSEVKVVKPTVAKETKEQKAAARKELSERAELIYRTTSVIVPIWYGQTSVGKVFKSQQIESESALCLMLIGAHGNKGSSVVGIEINLRPSGFDRSEAHLLAHMGTMSLLGHKMVKWVKTPKTEEDYRLYNVVLTAKGQKVFDCAKRSILAPVK